MAWMKVYTQEDFDRLERGADGYLHCPSGDWSQVDFAGASRVMFGNGCQLGNRCQLGNECQLGDWCQLGDRCQLGAKCTLEGGRVKNAKLFKISNIGSRNDILYCYCDTETGNIYFRAGCWFSGLDEFVQRVHDVHAGTAHEKRYIAAVEMAKCYFAADKE